MIDQTSAVKVLSTVTEPSKVEGFVPTYKPPDTESSPVIVKPPSTCKSAPNTAKFGSQPPQNEELMFFHPLVKTNLNIPEHYFQ